MKTKSCKLCDSVWHSAWQCPLREKKYSLKPKKRINQMGAVAHKWAAVRDQWKLDNPPPYICGICSKPVSAETMVVDHILPRAARPDLRYVTSNLQPAHPFCNQLKGGSHG